ncbi:MAG: hypothetical protein R2794_10130 [Chitinophagales bacterium]
MRRTSVLYFVCLLSCCSITASLHATQVKTLFTWSYDHTLLSFSWQYESDAYLYYKSLPREYNDYTVYVQEAQRYPVIASLTDYFKKIAAEHNYSDWQLVECMIAFVQNLRYVSDGTYEYPRYPLETLVDKGGDCEDSAILLDAMLRALGFESILISPEKHMGVGIALRYPISGTAYTYGGKQYYYIETTGAGWGIGVYPEHLSKNVTVYDTGAADDARLLSEYSYTFKKYTKPDATFAEKPVETKAADDMRIPETFAEPTPENTMTIDVHNVVIDGRKETMVTKRTHDDGIVVDSE